MFGHFAHRALVCSDIHTQLQGHIFSPILFVLLSEAAMAAIHAIRIRSSFYFTGGTSIYFSDELKMNYFCDVIIFQET